MTKQLPVLTAKIVKEEHKVKFISLVDEPAIEVDAVALAKELESPVFFQDVDKQILAAPILIPNKKIYRNIDGYECYWVFPEDVVRQLAEIFNEEGNQQNINLMHQPDSKVDGAFLLENWIIETENDKSKAYGFDLPMGTWFGLVKIKDSEFWNSQVKTGKVKGYSIEGLMAFVELQKVKMSKNMEYGKFKLEKEATLDDGTIIYTTAADFEQGAPVFVVDEQGNQFAAKDGDYLIPSYGVISVKDGMVVEVVKEEPAPEPVAQTEEPAPAPTPAPEAKVKAELTPEDIEAVKAALMPLMDELNARVSNVEQRLNEIETGLNGAISEMKEDATELRTNLAAIKDVIPSNSVATPKPAEVRLATDPIIKDEAATLKKIQELAESIKNNKK